MTMDRKLCGTPEHIRLDRPPAGEPGCTQVSVLAVLRSEWLPLAVWSAVTGFVFILWHGMGAVIVAGVFVALLAAGFFWNLAKGHMLGCCFLSSLASVLRVTEGL
ncbi:hypothetical protein ACIPW5_33815 [Streptomyces sp. NPDC090077]|uniref:hypothetical protein n=1 Tax=Streptomyces sp. NPDC090077 TaxID=3365938 RepID=UPI0038162D1D